MVPTCYYTPHPLRLNDLNLALDVRTAHGTVADFRVASGAAAHVTARQEDNLNLQNDHKPLVNPTLPTPQQKCSSPFLPYK